MGQRARTRRIKPLNKAVSWLAQKGWGGIQSIWIVWRWWEMAVAIAVVVVVSVSLGLLQQFALFPLSPSLVFFFFVLLILYNLYNTAKSRRTLPTYSPEPKRRHYCSGTVTDRWNDKFLGEMGVDKSAVVFRLFSFFV
ncbi:hypothetical protein B0T22DRAFT_4180 [Podospora appendiculata]|uniref:Uncharacterized protein n=1 Tax=Podospora appendiculata TaxID=314037 RepID=A0AAE0XF86_9PEZI|nr:hypothetical protein B0T22DRAFT_4180 [Podospora appendiculata]